MAGFFKSFGKGVLYIFVLPFLLVFLVLYGLYGLVVFLIFFVKSIILFFTGRSLDDDLPEDKKAKEILDAQAGKTSIIEEQPKVEDNSYSIYRPLLDPFSTPEANTDPIKSTRLEEPKIEEIKKDTSLEEVMDEPLEEDTQEVDNPEVETINSSLDDLLEDPVPEEKIEEVIPSTPVFEEDFEEIKTSGNDDDKYKPQGAEEYSIDEIDDNDSDEEGVDISFDSF